MKPESTSGGGSFPWGVVFTKKLLENPGKRICLGLVVPSVMPRIRWREKTPRSIPFSRGQVSVLTEGWSIAMCIS
jgi:hypothetical protein